MLSAPVFDVQRCCAHDGPGLRTTVFLAGCPLRCAWCHNPEAFAGTTARVRTVDDVFDEVLRDAAFYAATGGGVTVSGGEPLLHPAFVRALLGSAKARGLHTCVQTSAAVTPGALDAVLGVVDLFQVDLKHPDPRRHRTLTGADNGPVLENARRLVSRGATVEFRIPLVPGFTDTAGALEATARFLRAEGALRVTVVPYQRLYLDKYARLGLPARCAEVAPPGPDALAAAAARLRAEGVEAVLDA